MGRRRHTAEEIVNKLRQADVELGRGRSAAEVCKHFGISEPTYYAWRREYGGLKVDQARRFKELEQENARLKRLLADAELNKAILKEAGRWPRSSDCGGWCRTSAVPPTSSSKSVRSTSRSGE